MRVLMTTQPGLGHLHPMVPVARALQGAGHEVRFACARSFQPYVESFGLGSMPAGLDWLESDAESHFPELTSGWLRPENHLGIVRDVFAGIAAERMIPDLLAACRDWRPDLIVRNDFELAGGLVAERLGIPDATIGIEFLMPIQLWRSLIGPQLMRLRVLCGLPAHPALAMLYRFLYLTFIPPSYQMTDLRSVPVAHFLRPVPLETRAGAGLPAWVAELPQRPTVYATLGTVFNRTAEVFEILVEGLGGEPVNLILTVGPGRDPAGLGPLPPNVRVERYLPQSLLFPRCDLVITHGGINTILGALSHGVPLLVVPISAHHPFHAARITALSLGKALRRADRTAPAAAGTELSASAVREAVREILRSSEIRANARQIAEEMAALPGVDHAVELLERLAEQKTAQLTASPNAVSLQKGTS
jgi:UDP:flavonoid glycosyltransferase YjiC (YdhE family)